MRDVLVTGAAGFIGSAVAERLVALGDHVTTVDNLTTGSAKNIPAGCEVIIGDTFNPEVISQLVSRRFDAMIHLAGQSGGIPSFKDPVYDLHSNVSSTLMLLEVARQTGCSKFVYASSMAVYGDPTSIPVGENAPLVPKSFYGVGKMASEHYLRLYSDYGIRCIALRLNNVYGPGQDLTNLSQGMVSIFLGQALVDHSIHVRGDGNRFRDFVYIDDVVECFVLARKEMSNEGFSIYNVATGIATTVRELIQLIQGSLPFEVAVQYDGSTPGDQFGIVSSIERITGELNWSPTIRIEDGIGNMVRWALSSQIAHGETGTYAKD